MKQDKEDNNRVNDIVSVWSYPYDKSDELFTFSSGRVAIESTKHVLLTEKKKGTDALITFFETGLLSNPKSFYDTV